MKNRRSIIIAFLLCASLIVGVGYAALNDVMDITGTTEFNSDDTFDGNITFISATADDSNNTASVNPDNADKASFTVHTIATEGDSATFTFTIKNENSAMGYVSFRAYTLNTDATNYYSVDTVISNGTDNVQNTHKAAHAEGEKQDLTNAVSIDANGTATVTVTVTLDQTPDTATAAISASFTIELYAMDRAGYDAFVAANATT